MNGDKKLAVFGIAAACVIGLINHMQYRNLAKRMEDLDRILALPGTFHREPKRKKNVTGWTKTCPGHVKQDIRMEDVPPSKVSSKAALSRYDYFQYGREDDICRRK